MASSSGWSAVYTVSGSPATIARSTESNGCGAGAMTSLSQGCRPSVLLFKRYMPRGLYVRMYVSMWARSHSFCVWW